MRTQSQKSNRNWFLSQITCSLFSDRCNLSLISSQCIFGYFHSTICQQSAIYSCLLKLSRWWCLYLDIKWLRMHPWCFVVKLLLFGVNDKHVLSHFYYLFIFICAVLLLYAIVLSANCFKACAYFYFSISEV